MSMDRRTFTRRIALGAGSVMLLPVVTACGGATKGAAEMAGAAVPLVKPDGWDPVGYNKVRGNAGAIPASYLPSINGPEGEKGHLGKHLPYIPKGVAEVPEGYVAIMWGDPDKGHVRHPNAAPSESNKLGHWYNWIKVRKAVAGDAEELQSSYAGWPAVGEGDNGAYKVLGGGEITDDKGKNTIYLVALPKDVKSGDTVRIHAHCLTHGEYVDFITV